MRKYIALFTAVLLLSTSMAGCIDIHIFRDLFVPTEEEVIDYTTNRYNLMTKIFNTTLIPFNPDNILESYSGEFDVEIIPMTDSVLFDIDVQMESGEEVWEIINETWPGDLPDELEERVEQILEAASQRYIEVTITSPEGVEWFHARFNDTESVDTDRIQSPSEGEWKVYVDGVGVGPDATDFGIELAYHDSISIDVTIREPIV